MSVSKWAYTPEKCDGDFCPGACDNCGKAWDGKRAGEYAKKKTGPLTKEDLVELLHDVKVGDYPKDKEEED